MTPQPAAVRRAIPPRAAESIWQAADDLAIRRIDWPVPSAPRGSLLFLPGRGDSYEKWLESLEHWAGQGWAVTSIDWRGQALSGRQKGDTSIHSIGDFEQWIEDLAAFWQDWTASRPGPHVIVAHSMGGHLALRALAERRIRPASLVLSAPMLDLHPGSIPARLLLRVARLIEKLGIAHKEAMKRLDGSEVAAKSRQRLLTHDDGRYADEQWWRAQRPGIAMGPATWGWISRALASICELEQPGALESINIPVMLFGTTADALVSWRAIERAAGRIPGAELVAFGNECRHEILREVDEVRNRALDAIDSFLARTAPAAA
jgi:lysophospholipase